MSASRDELPMAPVGCTLTDSLLAEQLQRYRRLGTAATRIMQRDLELAVWFDPGVDLALLTETLAIERRCCEFFALDYAASERRLLITVGAPERLDALEALRSALSGQPPAVLGPQIDISLESHHRPHELNDAKRPGPRQEPIDA